MRILLLTVDFPPSAGGIQNLLAHIADGLAAEHDVSVVAPRRAGDAAFDAGRRYAVTRAPSAGWWPLVMLAFAVTGLLRALRHPPGIVVCGHALIGPPCWMIARLFGAPLVVITHAYEIRAPRMRTLAGWTLRRATGVVSVSEFTRRTVIGYGVAPDRVVVIHPGAASSPDSAPAGSSLAAAGFSHTPASTSPYALPSGGERKSPHPYGERIILTVARLGELYKGHDMMIRALPLILAREPRTRYVIVGDGPLRLYLERLAKSLGVMRAVTFAREVSNEALDAWYRRCDVFALVSRESPIDGGAEGYGLTFIEAGAWGKPVIGGNSGGVPDAVIDGVTGLLVDPTDVAAIAEAALRILGDPDLARRLGAQGRERAINELSWPNFVRAFEEVLESAMGPARSTAPVRSIGS